MRERLVAGLLAGFAAVAPPPGGDPAAARVGDAEIRGCVRPGAMTADEIADCLQGLIERADARMRQALDEAGAGLDPASAGLLAAAQARWAAFREGDVAANNGPWRQGRGTGLRVAAMTNAITSIRERGDEIRALYLEDRPVWAGRAP